MTMVLTRLLASALMVSLGLLGVLSCSDPPVLELRIVTPQGTDPLLGVDRARIHITNPATSSSFSVTDPKALFHEAEIEVESAVGVITLEALAQGKLAARGETPPMVLAPEEGTVNLLVGKAGAISLLRDALPASIQGLHVQHLVSGVMFCGGTDAKGAAQKQAVAYDIFQHQLRTLGDLPGPRRDAVTAPCGTGCMVLALGQESQGLATEILSYNGTSWLRFVDGLAASERRRLASVAPLGDGTHLVAGGLDASGQALQSLLRLDPGADSTIPSLKVLTAKALAARTSPAMASTSSGVVLVAGGEPASGPAAELFRRDSLTSSALTLPGSEPRSGPTAYALTDGTLILVGGKDASGQALRHVWKVDPTTGQVTQVADALATGRALAGVIQVDNLVLVVGGTGATGPLKDAEVLDASTLKSQGVVVLATARTRPQLARMGPGSVLIAGGEGLNTAPTELEVYETSVLRP